MGYGRRTKWLDFGGDPISNCPSLPQFFTPHNAFSLGNSNSEIIQKL